MTNTQLKKVVDNLYKESITINDKEVLEELNKLTKTKQKVFVNTLLDLGIRIWKFSRTEIDYQKLDDQRIEYIQNVEQLGKDLESELADQLDSIINSKNGSLTQAVSRESDKLTTNVQELFNSDKKSSVPAKIEQIVSNTVASLTKEFLIEIKKLNDASDVNSPLSKIKDQTIKGITEPVNELLKTVTGIADALQTNALVQKEAEKGTKKGQSFEDNINEILHSFANISGDILDEVGHKEGSAKTGQGKKKGDHVVLVSDSDGTSSRIVFESKDLLKKQTTNKVLQLLDESCNNRQAKVGIYVASSLASSPVSSNFARLAPNRYAVVVNKETFDTTALEVCYQVSRLEALADVRTNKEDKDQFDIDMFNSSLKNLRELVNLIVTIRENMSKAESDISAARTNVDKLENGLTTNIANIDTAVNQK